MRSFITAAVIFVALFYVTYSRQFTKCEEWCLTVLVPQKFFRADLFDCHPGTYARNCLTSANELLGLIPEFSEHECPYLNYFIVSEVQRYIKFRDSLPPDGHRGHSIEYCTQSAYEKYRARGTTDIDREL
ncbi:hypothetical protein RB195_020903 [Necator americanus]|uniref:Uncharacterized protein n=2 Tax=Necator americanus TaxID=51031 RepID=W2SPB4_NECAM|nr:hypothetical protein NECAME_14183 [Necator americanus]ETN71534.1 hypothetical protein NECAME_14183 [Necator americanus]